MRSKKLTTFCALSAALVLSLSLAPRHAEAQVCKALKGVKNANCVRSKDVKDESLSHNDVRNMAGIEIFRFGGGKMRVPTKGWVTVSTLARIDASGAAGSLEVVCRIIPSGTAVTNAVSLSVRESVNPNIGVIFANISATTLYAVSKGTLKVTLQCGQMAGSGVEIEVIDLTAKFVPTRYKAKR